MIVIVDYGMGNLRSVSKAIEHLGGKVKVSSDFSEIKSADKLVLPGVGAFGEATKELKSRSLFEPIKDFVLERKPFLGICLGLQLLFDSSEESPGASGLGIFPGMVRAFSSREVKIPHMGWNSATLKTPHPLLKGIPDGSFFYFVHSYYAVPTDSRLLLGETQYGEEIFSSILGTETLFAVQFHPEKSQSSGLRILKNFISW